MRMFRRVLAATALGGTLVLAGCIPIGNSGLDFAIRSNDGWTGLPIEELLLRPTLKAELLAACFDASCPEPAAVLTLRASGKDATDLMATFNNPQALVALLNKRDSEDFGKTRRAIHTMAKAERMTVAGLPAFSLSLIRSDKPERSMYAVAVAKAEAASVRIVLAIGAQDGVAMANAEAAASELLK
jgi:hypothetical protein